MAWINCCKCGRRISDKNDICPKCGYDKTRIKNNVWKKHIFGIFNILLSLFFSLVLVIYGDELLYTEILSDLNILFSLIFALMFCLFLIFRNIYLLKKMNFYKVFLMILGCCFLVINGIYLYKTILALYYSNSLELVELTNKYGYKDAKKIKKEIERVFEYDYENVYSRDVLIDNFYEDGHEYVLYLNDVHGNYKLRFRVEMKNYKFREVYYEFDDNKMYLIKNYKKTNNFEYYYAMYILSNVLGEDISGVSTITHDIESDVSSEYDAASYMFTYDGFKYNSKENKFSLDAEVITMDYYGNVVDYNFDVFFTLVDGEKKRKIWYYGDSSFDYVNFDVKI